MKEMIERLKKNLQTKVIDGETMYFYPMLGWVNEERLSESDIIAAEKWKEFVSNPENVCNCDICPQNEGFSSWPGNQLPCGQFRCWVSLHTEE